MSFAAPLGVGLESNGEYMDVEVNSFTSCEDIVNRLNQASVEGIEILSAVVLPKEAGNAMASVAAAGYSVRFREGREPAFDWRGQMAAFFARETKRGTAEINLKSGIFAFELQGDSIYMLLNASSAGNIKPQMVIEAFLAAYHDTLKENALMITREETYTNIGTQEAPELVPLAAVGLENVYA